MCPMYILWYLGLSCIFYSSFIFIACIYFLGHFVCLFVCLFVYLFVCLFLYLRLLLLIFYSLFEGVVFCLYMFIFVVGIIIVWFTLYVIFLA